MSFVPNSAEFFAQFWKNAYKNLSQFILSKNTYVILPNLTNFDKFFKIWTISRDLAIYFF